MQLGAASGLEVLNRAVSGRSSASFLAEGHLDRALEELRPGDLVLIAFGHNDPKDDERFADVHLAYPAALRRIDRKSTRLNSSHVAISYAVLCLKKRKRRITNDGRSYSGHNY